MKPTLLLLLAVTAAGCGEAYDAPETPYIVSIDPQPQLYDHEAVRHYSLVPYLIRLKQEDVRTITVTFSRTPELPNSLPSGLKRTFSMSTPRVGNSSDANSA